MLHIHVRLQHYAWLAKDVLSKIIHLDIHVMKDPNKVAVAMEENLS